MGDMNVWLTASDLPNEPAIVAANNAAVSTTVCLVTLGTVLRIIFSWWLMRQFWKGNSYYSTAFFQLYVIQGIPDWVMVVQRIVHFTWGVRPRWFVFLYQFLMFDWDITVGLLDSILMVNRLTAIVFWRWHKRIWSGWTVAAVAIAMKLYPFLLLSPLWPSFGCLFIDIKMNVPNCVPALRRRQQIQVLSNLVHSILPLLMGALVFVLQRKLQFKQDSLKRELRLLYMCVICDCWLLVNVSTNFVLQRMGPTRLDSVTSARNFVILFAVSSGAWNLYTYSFFVLAVLFNNRIRAEIKRFLARCCPKTITPTAYVSSAIVITPRRGR